MKAVEDQHIKKSGRVPPGASLNAPSQHAPDRYSGPTGPRRADVALQSSHRPASPSTRRTARSDPTSAVYGALDLGTNNCRLLLARPTRRGFRVVDAFSRIIRLGEGVAQSGRLSDHAMSRTIEALKVCAGKLDRACISRYSPARRRRALRFRGARHWLTGPWTLSWSLISAAALRN